MILTNENTYIYPVYMPRILLRNIQINSKIYDNPNTDPDYFMAEKLYDVIFYQTELFLEKEK